MALRDPDKKRERNALLKSEDVKSTSRRMRRRSICGDCSARPILRSVEVGATPAAAAAATAELREVLEEAILDANGDASLAWTMASERMKSRYGVSEFSLGAPARTTEGAG